MSRYFPATVMGGRLYVQGIGTYGPWDSQQLPYQVEGIVDQILRPLLGERKIHTREELVEAVRRSDMPAATIWIGEGLEVEARRIHEAQLEMRRKQDHRLEGS
jgi:hypothetical protein